MVSLLFHLVLRCLMRRLNNVTHAVGEAWLHAVRSDEVSFCISSPPVAAYKRSELSLVQPYGALVRILCVVRIQSTERSFLILKPVANLLVLATAIFLLSSPRARYIPARPTPFECAHDGRTFLGSCLTDDCYQPIYSFRHVLRASSVESLRETNSCTVRLQGLLFSVRRRAGGSGALLRQVPVNGTSPLRRRSIRLARLAVRLLHCRRPRLAPPAQVASLLVFVFSLLEAVTPISAPAVASRSPVA